MKDKVIGMIIVLLLWGTVTLFIGTPWPWKLWIAKQESLAHLEGKYGEPFTMDLPRFWIMDGHYHAEASPKAHPEIIFWVGTQQESEGIQDNYDAVHKQYVREQSTQLLEAQAFPEQAITVAVHKEFGLDGHDRYEDVLYITLYEKEQSLQQLSARLYPLIPQLQALPVYGVTISLRYKYKKLQLRNDTELASEEDFYALWRDVE